MKLYGIAGSPNTWKVRAVAHRTGTPLDFIEVDVMTGATRTPEFLAMNPNGLTPVLVDGDFVLWESTAILQYIAAKSASDLWPDEIATRADIMRWLSWQLAHWGPDSCQPLIWQNVLKPMFNLGQPDAEAVAKAEAQFRKHAAILEQALTPRDWLAGPAPTLADYSVGSFLFYAEPARMPLAEFAHVARWFQRLASQPEWMKVAPARSDIAA